MIRINKIKRVLMSQHLLVSSHMEGVEVSPPRMTEVRVITLIASHHLGDQLNSVERFFLKLFVDIMML